MILEIVSLVMLITAFNSVYYVFIYIQDIPYHVTKKKIHPQFEPIHNSWLSANSRMYANQNRKNVMNRWQVMISILALSPVVTLSGCAASTADVEDESLGAAERVCVNVRSINSFDAIDDQHLYIKATSNNHYLFTLYGGCHGLRSAHGIAVKDTFTRVCSNSYGEVIFRDMGRGLESCRIRHVESVASKEDAKGLVEDRKEAKREEKASD